jgi:hypothetical protein
MIYSHEKEKILKDQIINTDQQRNPRPKIQSPQKLKLTSPMRLLFSKKDLVHTKSAGLVS